MRLVFKWAGHPRVTDVSGFEYSIESAFDATLLVYDDGSNFCANTMDIEKQYVPESMHRDNNVAWYRDSGATHHVFKEVIGMNATTPIQV